MFVSMELSNGTPSTKKVSFPVRGKFALGWNLEGMDDVATYQAGPGIVWPQPGVSDLKALVSCGGNLVRLPFSWSAIQQKLYAPISPFYLGCIETFLSEAASMNVGVIPDCHTFGYGPNYLNALIGSPTVPVAAFADLWGQIAKALAGKPGLAGYDLMNEPKLDTNTWAKAAQAAITAIRAVDKTTPIVVEGINWDSPSNFAAANSGFFNQNNGGAISDPSNLLIASAHCYAGGSGTGYDWAALQAAGANVETINSYLTPFYAFCKQYGLPAMVGETGAGTDNSGWLMSLYNTLEGAMSANAWLTLWSAGPGWAQVPPNVYGFFCGNIGGVLQPQAVVMQALLGFAPTVAKGVNPILTGKYKPGVELYMTFLNANEYATAQATVKTDSVTGEWSHTVTSAPEGSTTIVLLSNNILSKNTLGGGTTNNSTGYDPIAATCFTRL